MPLVASWSSQHLPPPERLTLTPPTLTQPHQLLRLDTCKLVCFVSFHLLLCWSGYLTHHQPLFVFLGIPAASVGESSEVKAPCKICQNTFLSLLSVLFMCSFGLWGLQCQLAPYISTCISFVLNKMGLLTLETKCEFRDLLTFSNMCRFLAHWSWCPNIRTWWSNKC